MKKHLNYSFFLVLLLISSAFGPCSSATNTTSLNPPSVTNPNDGSSAIPTTSVPVQSAKVDTKKIIHYAPDSNGYSPVIGMMGAVVPDNNAKLKIVLIPQLSSFSENSTNVLPPGNDLCSINTCCDIQVDGSFECYPKGHLNTELNSYLTDGTTLYSLIEEKQKPNKSLLWLKDIPQGISVGPRQYDWNHSIENSDVLWTLGQNQGQAIVENTGNFTVTGNYQTSYLAFESQEMTQLAYDPNINQLGGLIPNNGLPISTFNNSLGLLDPTAFNLVGLNQVPDTILYNKIKYTDDGFMRFIRKPQNPTGTEYIYNATDPSINNIKFIDNDLNPISTISNTVAFDVEASGWGLVLFEENNNLRFRLASHTNSYRYGGKVSGLSCSYNNDGICNYTDLLIYQNNSDNNANSTLNDSVDKGRALLLDTHNRVGMISYDYQNGTDPKIDSWLNLGDGKNPIAMVLNSHKDTAYILNQGDNTISVLTLKNGFIPLKASRIGLAELNLEDYLDGKNSDIIPTSLEYYHNNAEEEYLLVGSADLKGAIVINLN